MGRLSSRMQPVFYDRHVNLVSRLDDGVLWDAPFELLPLSTSANAAELRGALAAMGLTLTRASGATCMTSASTLVASGIGVDDPRVGDGGNGRGLVIEEGRTNYNSKARSFLLVDGWTNGGAVITGDAMAGPDGSVAADRQQVASGAFGVYRTVLSGVTYTTASMWRRSGTGAVASHAWFIVDGANAASNQNDALGPTWERSALTIASPGGGVGPISTCDGRTLGAPYNLTAGARDAALDLLQVEVGRFPTESIITTGSAATRAADIFVADSWSRFVRGGVLSMEWQFIPKCSPGNGSNSMWLIGDVADEVRVAVTVAGGVSVKHGPGGGGTSTGSLPGTSAAWAAGDVVRIHVEAGNLQTRVAVSVNGAPRTLLTMSAVTPAPFTVPVNPPRLLNYQSNAHMNCWLQRIRAYAPGRRPSWAA